MAYIGAEPLPGQNREVDDISSSFNGSTTAFTLQVNGLNVSPETVNNILVNLGGVIQNPGTDYTIAASTLTFTTAPASGLSFFAIILGAGINTASVADQAIGTSKILDNAVTADKLAHTSVTAGSYTTADITVDAQGRITAAASGTIANAEIADGAITNAKVNASAAIARTKLANVDVVDDTSPQLGGDLDLNGNKITGGADIDLTDSGQIKIGTGDDLSLFHDGTDSHIKNDTGELKIRANNVQFRTKLDDETLADFNANGAVELYHNNSKKFETSSVGVNVTGNFNVNDGIAVITHSTPILKFEDNSASSGGDFAINVNANQFKIVDTDNSDRMGFQFGSDGNTALGGNTTFNGSIRASADSTHDVGTNSVRFANGYFDTLYGDGSNLTGISSVGGSTGVDFNDGVKVRFGTGNDGEIFHNGTDFHIDGEASTNGTRNVYITGGSVNEKVIELRSKDNEPHIRCFGDGAVEIYHNNTKQIETTSGGTIIQGNTAGFAHTMKNNRSGTGPSGLQIEYPNGGDNNNTRHFLACVDAGPSTKCLIDSNGNLRNVNNSYAVLSDVSLKENIVDASSQWDDIKNIKIRNFNWKESSGNETYKQIGVVAQELETVCPNLVEANYFNGVDQGTKYVKSSILYMKAIKALQEAMAKIEVLETKVAALEAA